MATSALLITVAAIGTAPGAMAPPRAAGWSNARLISCRLAISNAVITLSAEIADIAWQSKALFYDLLFSGTLRDDDGHRG